MTIDNITETGQKLAECRVHRLDVICQAEKLIDAIEWTLQHSPNVHGSFVVLGEIAKIRNVMYEWKPIPSYGDLMTMGDFMDQCKSGGLIDYDGTGRYSDGNRMNEREVSPSDVINKEADRQFTHVVWFNK